MASLNDLIGLSVLRGHPQERYLRGLSRLIVDDDLDRAAVDHAFGDFSPRERAHLYLTVLRAALWDHALSDEELTSLRHLRAALGVGDGTLLETDAAAVERIVGDVLRHLLVDNVIDDEEAQYKVALQESLALGYDDFLRLGWGPMRQALLALMDQMAPGGRGLTADEFIEYERRALHLQSVFRLDIHQTTGSTLDSRSRRIPQHVKDAVWRRDGGSCVECASNELLEFDHIVPFSKGGASSYRNVQLLCQPCNRRKSDLIG